MMSIYMNIGQLSKRVGASKKTIRYYEAIGILPEPERGPNHYRKYTDEYAEIARFVVGARALGLSLQDIKPLVDAYENGRAPCEHVFETIDNNIIDCTEKISQLTELRIALTVLKNEGIKLSNSGGNECVCALIGKAGDKSNL